MSKIFIHPTSIVETKNIGAGTYIGPFCFVSERVIIGKNCKLIGSCSIGTPAEYKTLDSDESNSIVIGDNVEIREFVTINTPATTVTEIGNDCFLMTKSHVGHDAVLGNDVVLSCGSRVGGYSCIGSYSYVGLNACTHQRSTLGAYSIVGANSFFKGQAPMGITWGGVPARPIKVNEANINKNAVDNDKQCIIDKAIEFVESFKK